MKPLSVYKQDLLEFKTRLQRVMLLLDLDLLNYFYKLFLLYMKQSNE